MKKIIKQAVLLSLFLNFASCIPDDQEIDYTTSNGNTVLTTTTISRLDKSYDLPIKITTKEGVTASKIEVFYNTSTVGSITAGDKVGDAVIAADGKSATINTNLLKDFEHFGTTGTAKTGTFSLVLKSTFSDGSTLSNAYTLTVGKGISWYVITDGSDVLTTSTGIPEIKYLDNTEGVNLVRYKVAKKTATAATVVMSWKKGKDGVYADSPLTFPATKGYFDLGTIDYTAWGLKIGDVLYLKFTVTAGTQVDYVETSINIVTQGFPTGKTGSLTGDLSANKFNLAEGASYANTDTTNGEIVFSSPVGFAKEGATAIDFVKVAAPSATYYKDATLFTTRVAYTAGTKVTAVNNLVHGDVVIYKVTRGEDVYYGLINVGDVSTLNGVNTFGFEYKEGVIIE